jgi:arylsulfatase A-like enzyme
MNRTAFSISTIALLPLACLYRTSWRIMKQKNPISFCLWWTIWAGRTLRFHSGMRGTHFNDRYHTPNMERLAAEGMKFTQAYACAVCSPTRTSLMTGMNAARHRVTNWTLRYNHSQDQSDDVLEMPLWNMNGSATGTDTVPHSVHATTLSQLLKENGILHHSLRKGTLGHHGYSR